MKNGEFNWICHVWACLPRVCSHWLKLMEFKIIRFNYSDMISCKLKMQWLRCVNVFYLYIPGYACNSNTIWQDNRRHNTHLSGMAQHVWCKIYHLCLMLLHRPGSYMTNIVFLCVLGQLSPDMSIPYYTQQPLPVYFYRCQANRRQRLSHPAEGLLENTCYHRNEILGSTIWTISEKQQKMRSISGPHYQYWCGVLEDTCCITWRQGDKKNYY